MTIKLISLASLTGLLAQAGDGGTAELDIAKEVRKAIANGVNANQANAIYIDEFSIAASGTLNIDVAGSLTDRLGNALVFTAIKEIWVIADDSNTNDIVFGNGTNPFAGPLSAGTTTITLKPGNDMRFRNYSAAGWAITGASNDVIKLANSGAGTAVTGTIIIIGEI